MSKREKIIGIITAVVFIFWLQNFFGGDQDRKPKKQTTAKTSRPRTQAVRHQKSPSKPVEDKKFSFDWQAVIDCMGMEYEDTDAQPVRDPFAELDYRDVFSSSALDFSELSLSGIIWEEEAPLALINNQILGIGEMISGFKIDEISKNEVILIKGTEKFMLRLYSPQFSE